MGSSLKTGFNVSLASGIITMLGLVVGLYAGTHSRPVVIGGLLSIAVANGLADALTFRLSEEPKGSRGTVDLWSATIATMAVRCVIAFTFIVPTLALVLPEAILVNVLVGATLLAMLGVVVARARHVAPWKIIGVYLLIGLGVMTITYYLGEWIRTNVA